MLSVRQAARFAPRTISRLATPVATLRTASRFSSSSSSIKASPSSINTALRLNTSSRAFSTTALRRAAAADGEIDDELSAKLESEIQVEEDMVDQEPASVKDFLENSQYELIDNAGQETVKLQRTFGDEKITVSFSIADITNYDPYGNEDPALEDEADIADNVQNTNKQPHVQSTGGARSAPAQEEMEDEDMEDPLDESPTPISLSIVIEKPNKTKGALHVDATAQDGNIIVDNMFFYEDAKIANAESPEAAQQRAEVYPGPPFGSLDEDLQVLMERYLEERGITQAMAVFVPDYVDVKEQREYARWLGNVKGFVDA